MQEPNNCFAHTASGDAQLSLQKMDIAWHRELQSAVRGAAELCALLGISPAVAGPVVDEYPDFPLLVPRSYVARMARENLQDPLLLQVLSRLEERNIVPGYSPDPLTESRFAADGILHKYSHRILLITTGSCPIHCRYCFRREFPYADQLAARSSWRASIEHLRANPHISEVILSGGDPLSLSTERISALFAQLETIDTVHTVRIHTRFPIAIPSRIHKGLLNVFAQTRLRVVVVIHSNHANELNADDVRTALRNLALCTTVLNQSVLLHGINDDAQVLANLSNALFATGVMPYYLHLLDRVHGAAHFEVNDKLAIELISKLRAELPGYLVPRLVREDPGALSKTIIA